jgi:HSP90 family molecular chaperone
MRQRLSIKSISRELIAVAYQPRVPKPEAELQTETDNLEGLFEKDHDNYLKFWGRLGRALKEGVSS